jgi:transcriptional regulator with GAF, ATPase, and Fis domain
MKATMSDVRVVANYQTPVLIQGPTGTGKEIIASALHGPRRGKFVAINCTAMPSELIQSELFGHKRGAFTGAVSDRIGKILDAHLGTLFLDEIGDMPQDMQAKLLRVLQNKRFTPLGDEVEISSEFRLVCATNRDLAGMVNEGTFREDLYYRIAPITLRTTPLSDRIDDVPLIVRALYPSVILTDAEHESLVNREYCGNVRELINIMEHRRILHKFPTA